MITEIRQWLSKWNGVLVGLVLCALSLIGLRYCPSVLGQKTSEAVLIAGMLAIVVDPFLKQRLVKEASRDIFHHLIGFELPVQIRERLRDIVLYTDLYRKDMHFTCTFTAVESGIQIEFETDYEIVNPSHKDLKFRQILEFEKAENAQLNRIECDPPKKGYGQDAALTFNNETGLFEYEGKEINVEPKSLGKRYRIWADSRVVLPLPGFFVQHMKYPTIGVTLHVRNAPLWLKISTDLGPGPGPHWISDQLFMPGDKFIVRWERLPQK